MDSIEAAKNQFSYINNKSRGYVHVKRAVHSSPQPFWALLFFSPHYFCFSSPRLYCFASVSVFCLHPAAVFGENTLINPPYLATSWWTQWSIEQLKNQRYISEVGGDKKQEWLVNFSSFGGKKNKLQLDNVAANLPDVYMGNGLQTILQSHKVRPHRQVVVCQCCVVIACFNSHKVDKVAGSNCIEY